MYFQNLLFLNSHDIGIKKIKTPETGKEKQNVLDHSEKNYALTFYFAWKPLRKRKEQLQASASTALSTGGLETTPDSQSQSS